jgi:hypothetical protein
MNVCAVTCTGGRPELFELCKRWIAHQTRPVDKWIVATDNGEVITDLPAFASHMHVERVTTPAPNTDWVPNHSLRQALLAVPEGHAAVVFEDDDWYSPKHVERCVQQIGLGHEVVYGTVWMRYHVPLRQWNTKVRRAPGEGRVMIRADAVRKYADSLVNRPLYEGPTDGRYPDFTVVGIKGVGYGLPGRAGASDMHRGLGMDKKFKIVNRDPHGTFLRTMLGDDADLYLNLVER